MKSFVFINFFLLVLFASSIESRHEPRDHDWTHLMDDESLHEPIEDLTDSNPNSKKKMDDCNFEDGKLLAQPRPRQSASFYPDNTNTKLFVDDIKLPASIAIYLHEINAKLAKIMKPPSTVSFYLDDTKSKFLVEDIEPRPNASFYPDDAKTNDFVEDIEPRPNASFYPDDTKTKLFAKDVEPRPNASFYPDDDTKTKLFVEDVEPRPNISFYPDNDTKTKLFVEDANHGKVDTKVAQA